jgi:hypothetical protein
MHTHARPAWQVADIMLMMRNEDELPSDFLPYTLVVIVAVSGHLMKVGLGEDYGLQALGERYGHDPAGLDLVFWHILTRLSYFRELHMRLQQLVEVCVVWVGMWGGGNLGC